MAIRRRSRDGSDPERKALERLPFGHAPAQTVRDPAIASAALSSSPRGSQPSSSDGAGREEYITGAPWVSDLARLRRQLNWGGGGTAAAPV